MQTSKFSQFGFAMSGDTQAFVTRFGVSKNACPGLLLQRTKATPIQN
jgi:hypothetical protein